MIPRNVSHTGNEAAKTFSLQMKSPFPSNIVYWSWRFVHVMMFKGVGAETLDHATVSVTAEKGPQFLMIDTYFGK